jgi:hypothetical protein
VNAGANSRVGGDLLNLGRAQGGAALVAYYDRVRETAGRDVVVLHDPSGPMFPFLEPPDVDLLILERSADAVALAVGAGGVQRVIESAHDVVDAFRRRVAAFGISAERTHRVADDVLWREPRAVWPEVCRFLGLPHDDALIDAMTAGAQPKWSVGGLR